MPHDPVTRSLIRSLCLILFGALFAILPHHSIAGAKLEIDIPYIMNLDVINLTGRFGNNTDWRDDITLQIPFTLMKAAKKKEYGAHFGFYIGGATYSNYDSIRTSTTGFGRFYFTIHDEEREQTFIPYFTIYRAQTVEYLSGGVKQNTDQVNYLTPGLLLGYTINKATSFHVEIEENSYENFSRNYQIRSGLAYQLTPEWRASLSREERGWDYPLTLVDQVHTIAGQSQLTLLRFIRKVEPSSITPFTHVSIGIGHENLDRYSSGSLMQTGNTQKEGYIIQLSVSVGKMMW